MTMPDDISFNAIVKKDNLTAGVNTKLSTFHNSFSMGTLERYKLMKESRSDEILDLVFAAEAETKRRAIIGDITRKQFLDNFTDGRKLLANEILQIFALKSFPETFFHSAIAQALVNTKKLTDKTQVRGRVEETAAMILRAINHKEKGLPVMLAVAESHRHRPPALYTEDSVEFTLLTFSYFGAKFAGIREGVWFFLFRVFGSFMGLPPDRLHATYAEAESHMRALRKQCPWPPEKNSEQLLDAYIAEYLSDDGDIKEAVSYKAISKRMYEYLKLKGRWPKDLARKPVTD